MVCSFSISIAFVITAEFISNVSFFVQKRLEEMAEAKGILEAKVHSLENLAGSLRADLRASKKENRALKEEKKTMEQEGVSKDVKVQSLEKQIGDLRGKLEAEQKEKGQLMKVCSFSVHSVGFMLYVCCL